MVVVSQCVGVRVGGGGVSQCVGVMMVEIAVKDCVSVCVPASLTHTADALC